MFLLSQEEMERMRQKQIKEYDPNLRAMARLQDEKDTVMTDKQMSPDEALKMLQKLQSRYEAIKNQDKAEVALPGVWKTMDAQGQTMQVDETPAVRLDTEPLIGIPVHLRSHARSLIRLLSKDPDVLPVNNQMELVVRDMRIPR